MEIICSRADSIALQFQIRLFRPMLLVDIAKSLFIINICFYRKYK